MENMSMRNEVELVYAKDIIPSLAFVPKPYVGYPKGYVADWRKHLMDVWGKSKAIGLKRKANGITLLAHPEDRWFMTKEAAVNWAKKAKLEVTNADVFK